VRYQTALHPVRVLPTQATLIIIPETRFFVNTFFQKNQIFFEKVSPQGFEGMIKVRERGLAGSYYRKEYSLIDCSGPDSSGPSSVHGTISGISTGTIE